MVRFIIVRHGYSEFNKENRFSGQADISLDKIGYSQAQSVAKYVLKKFCIDSIYSSDLLRAKDTAKPIAEALGLPIIEDKNLRELDVGEWEGMLITEVAKKYPVSFKIFKTNVGVARPDGGESYPELAKRVSDAFAKIASVNDGKTVLVATHGGVIRALRCAWLGLPKEEFQNVPYVHNASITIAEYSNGKGVFSEIGLDGYLEEKTTEKGFAVV